MTSDKSIQTTHIGSLPFKTTKEAISFNQHFTIPVLSTLPQVDPAEYMVEQVISGIPGCTFQNFKIQLPQKLNLFSYKFNFVLEEEFIEAFGSFEKCMLPKIKWQILGITTFVKLIGPTISNLHLEDLISWHASNIKNYHNFLKKKFKDVVLFLDEPMLNSEKDIALLNSFIKKLKTDDIVIHNCSKFSPLIFKNFKNLTHDVGLSFDLSLMDDQSLKWIDKNFKSIYLGVINPSTLQGVSMPKLENQDIYLTPTCGLALEMPNKIRQIPTLLLTR